MISYKSSRSRLSCWSIKESMCSKKSSWSQEVFDQSGSQWALIRAPDHNLVVGRSRGQCALIRAFDRKKFVTLSGSQISSNKSCRSQQVCRSIRTSMCSHKSSWSQEGFDQSGIQWDLIRSPDHNLVVGRLWNQLALIRAFDRKRFLIDQGVNELWQELLIARSLWSIGDRSGSQWALIRAPDRQSFWSIGDSMSSGESSRSQNACCSMRDRMSSDSSSLTQDVWLSIGK